MTRIPYIGICDYENSGQIMRSAKTLEDMCVRLKISRRLMAGIMISYKTMKDLPSRWAGVWPPKERIGKIFPTCKSVINTIHYADYENRSDLSCFLEATLWGGKNLSALQLDMIWPSPSDVINFREKRPDILVVLQVNTNALALANNVPSLVSKKLKEYAGSVDYALLDKSHGRGIDMNAEVLLPFVRKIKDDLPNMGIAVAGGLGPKTMHLLEPIAAEFPEISIDAQGKLRKSGDASMPIDWDLADEYLVQASTLFAR